jgi:hypothetical protein
VESRCKFEAVGKIYKAKDKRSEQFRQCYKWEEILETLLIYFTAENVPLHHMAVSCTLSETKETFLVSSRF